MLLNEIPIWFLPTPILLPGWTLKSFKLFSPQKSTYPSWTKRAHTHHKLDIPTGQYWWLCKVSGSLKSAVAKARGQMLLSHLDQLDQPECTLGCGFLSNMYVWWQFRFSSTYHYRPKYTLLQNRTISEEKTIYFKCLCWCALYVFFNISYWLPCALYF